MNRYAAILVATFLICTLAGVLAGCDDFEIHQQQVSTYCDMVARWKSDEAIGIPAEQRDGWPDYRGEYESVCLDNQRRIENELMAQRAGGGVMDILERLKGLQWHLWQVSTGSEVIDEAAAEIARLRAEAEDAKGETAWLRNRINEIQRKTELDLVNIYDALESASLDDTITDTIWMLHKVSASQTLFDYIDAAIGAARGGK